MIGEAAGVHRPTWRRDGVAAPRARADLHVPETITLLPLPPASPQLNPVERVWLYQRERYLSHRVLNDYENGVGRGLPRLEPAPRRNRPSHNPDGLSVSHRVSNSLTGY